MGRRALCESYDPSRDLLPVILSHPQALPSSGSRRNHEAFVSKPLNPDNPHGRRTSSPTRPPRQLIPSPLHSNSLPHFISPKMMRTSATSLVRKSLARSSLPLAAVRAQSTQAISNPTLANIEKRWEGMPLQEQADLWMALRDRMKGNWKELSVQEQKAGACFCIFYLSDPA